ncbi:restriction endonuclease subunit S [Staphylococcus aureus]|uniref:restriction endonuclease subunit S n=1 Tax=Staphylococcus aureus TaxID=1280 RepID=UPI001CD72149|nr:restriction endonuclease subunit S [Staphylococcus aureus]MCH4791068.1 restriction endonuclease subunit S [Staphylococcus aureus]
MSNTQKKNLPELRFPGFEGEWEEKKLGEFNNGINAKKEQYGMGRKFINVLDILNNNFITYESIIGKVSVPENVEKNNKVEFGDLVFLRSSETREDVGLCNVYLDKNYALYGGFIIRGKKVSDYNPIFLKEALNIPKKRYEIGSAAGGSTRFNVSQDILRKINVKFPSIKEQQKIGDLFSKLDRQIELEEQKLELLKQQKKGYMQKIFSQELRFKDENGNDYPDWENVMLQKVLKDKTEGIKRGPFGGALKKDIFVESGYAVYEQRNAIYDISNFRYYIDENKYNEMLSFSVQPNDIIMSCSGTIGRLSLIPQNFTKGIINQALIRFRTNHKIRSEFFLIFMRSNQMQRKILEANPGSAITNLVPVKELKLIPFPLPVKFEQDKISQFILIINRRIEQSEKKIESLKNRKQGFLQKLFI